MKNVFWVMNRKRNTAEIVTGFSHWELVQNAFHWGIMMSDGHSADAIGRCHSESEFYNKAAHGGTKVLDHCCPNCGKSEKQCDCDPLCPMTRKAW